MTNANRRAIGERLHRAKKHSVRVEIALDWRENWQTDQIGVLKDLEWAAKTNNRDLLISSIGQLRAVTEKRFEGLLTVILGLAEERP